MASVSSVGQKLNVIYTRRDIVLIYQEICFSVVTIAQAMVA